MTYVPKPHTPSRVSLPRLPLFRAKALNRDSKAKLRGSGSSNAKNLGVRQTGRRSTPRKHLVKIKIGGNGCSSTPKWSHRLCPLAIWVLFGAEPQILFLLPDLQRILPLGPNKWGPCNSYPPFPEPGVGKGKDLLTKFSMARRCETASFPLTPSQLQDGNPGTKRPRVASGRKPLVWYPPSNLYSGEHKKRTTHHRRSGETVKWDKRLLSDSAPFFFLFFSVLESKPKGGTVVASFFCSFGVEAKRRTPPNMAGPIPPKRMQPLTGRCFLYFYSFSVNFS